MVPYFRNNRLLRTCTDFEYCVEHYSLEFAQKLTRILNEIKSANNVTELCNNRIAHCHFVGEKNKKNKKCEYAMTILEPFRLGFMYNKKDKTVLIIYIKDYHHHRN